MYFDNKAFENLNQFRDMTSDRYESSELAINISAKYSRYRVPNVSILVHYDLFIKSGEFKFDGRVKIHVKIVEPTDVITLHSKEIAIGQANSMNENHNIERGNLSFAKVLLTIRSSTSLEFH